MRKVIADWPLDDHQILVAAQFIGTVPKAAEQRAFERGWRNSVEYEAFATEQGPDEVEPKEERRRKLEQLGHKIVPGNKQAAAPAHAAIHRLALEHIRQCGGVEKFDMAVFIKRVQILPEAQRYYRESGQWKPLSDNAIRTVLNNRVGIVGKPGAKKKT